MAKNLQPEEDVYVPWSRLPNFGAGDDHPSAFYKTKVVEVVDRSVRLQLPNGAISAPLGSSAIHRNIGILVVRIGDFGTEFILLDPLAKSVLQFSRLLVNDDVRLLEVRTLAELEHCWTKDHAVYRHVVFVGHGSQNGIHFGTEGERSAAQIVQTLTTDNVAPKIFISLCCQTGFAAFGKAFSKAPFCEAIVAPYHSIHGAVASQFCQTFLAFHLLDGRTTSVAFNQSSEAIPGGKSLRLWQNGKLKAGVRK
jgi:hypothetical protein